MGTPRELLVPAEACHIQDYFYVVKQLATVADALTCVVCYSHRVQGLVGYSSSDGDYGDGYSLALALTVAGQRHLLPVDATVLSNSPCIEEQYSMQFDLRVVPAVKAGRERLTIHSTWLQPPLD